MPNLLVDERDLEFVLFEQFKVDELCRYEPFQDLSRDLLEMVLKECRKMALEILMPINAVADREGCRKEGNQVRVPKDFHRAWRLYSEAGWIAPSQPAGVGGQGLPDLIGIPCYEHTMAANYAFYTFSGLTRGAARLLLSFGTEKQKQKYMLKMFSGEWTGTMCLTEPHAGSDVGALRTSAKRNSDGTYSISGGKIFITDGDHDLTENIVHMVLARVEAAPPGPAGISIFVVPKFRVNDDGALGDFNGITVSGIENKMGVHGSPTCVLNFEGEGLCVGELLGEENQGLRIMFNMINEARMGVGLQGLALASAAYLQALNYSKERTQGPDIKQFRNPEAPRVTIIHHPDVRRMLMYMKSLVEGIRSMIYFTAYCLDRVRISNADSDKNKWQGYLDLLTPVVKAYSTDMGFKVIENALQVHGGYGYTSEYPIEQYLRDIKIGSIWEGTNGIQALDLVLRKLTMRNGKIFQGFLEEVDRFVESVGNADFLGQAIEHMRGARRAVADTADFLTNMSAIDLGTSALAAKPFLELLGDMIVGWQLLWQATIAHEKAQSLFREKGAHSPEEQRKLIRDNGNAAYYVGKIAAAKFFADTVLALSPAKAAAIKKTDTSLLELAEECFG